MSVAGENLIGGVRVPVPGRGHRRFNPARPSVCVWEGSPTLDAASAAVAAARGALSAWSAWPLDRRAAVLRKFAALATARAGDLATIIRDETGKVTWDALGEAQLLATKIDITLDPDGPLRRVTGFEVSAAGTRRGACWFRPHGVMAVLGPFNFPMHLPHGHLAPALLMGNTAVFKPSEKAPASGQALAMLWQEALDAEGAPPGVINLVHGGADVAAKLAGGEGIDGVLFTGSWPVGRRILEANLDRPGRLLALEMGGNNAVVILADADLGLAVRECVRAAFISTGQRCTCTRRVIVSREIADRVIPALCKAASALIVGDPAATHPVFMGPMISDEARAGVLAAQARLAKAGGEVLVPMTPTDGGTGGWYMTPGVMRVEQFTLDGGAGADEEVFGPCLRVSVADSFEEALAQVNATRFGLAASLFTRDAAAMERFRREAQAGCVNVNTGTAGASSRLPFGGLGRSGNHRPAGAFSLDYCAYAVAGLEEHGEGATLPPGMHVDPRWLA
ncbi:MAG: N-succinylglutamate 5-semialdehyde dehydrogenase 1 [Phycisphaerae bacterium]|nr:MAG: N-succinylglutamate 5-semialdehyde dehydrogenase 1 [Phycisphaerae bacterium]